MNFKETGETSVFNRYLYCQMLIIFKFNKIIYNFDFVNNHVVAHYYATKNKLKASLRRN